MKRLLTVLLAASLFAVACGSVSPIAASTPWPATSSSSIQIVIFSFPEDFSSLAKAGATTQVIAIGLLTNGTSQDVTPYCTNWLSDNTRVLSVNSSGLVTAQSDSGTATISTTCRGVSASGMLTVNPPPPPPPFIPSPTPPGGSTCDVDSAPKIPECFVTSANPIATTLCNDGMASCSQSETACSYHRGIKCRASR